MQRYRSHLVARRLPWHQSPRAPMPVPPTSCWWLRTLACGALSGLCGRGRRIGWSEKKRLSPSLRSTPSALSAGSAARHSSAGSRAHSVATSRATYRCDAWIGIGAVLGAIMSSCSAQGAEVILLGRLIVKYVSPPASYYTEIWKVKVHTVGPEAQYKESESEELVAW